MPRVNIDSTGKGLHQVKGGGVRLMGVQSITATDAGDGTGQISANGGSLVVVDADSDADHIVTLPPPEIGLLYIITVPTTGCELRTSAPATIGINGVTGSGKELAISAKMTHLCVCTSLTNWAVIGGAALTAD